MDMKMIIHKLFCNITLRSLFLILGLMAFTELSANSEADYSASPADLTVQQGGGRFTLTGQVLDENKAGIPGATVIVKGSTRGAITDTDGHFAISVAGSDAIEISYLGYESQTIQVGAQTNIVVELARKVSELGHDRSDQPDRRE